MKDDYTIEPYFDVPHLHEALDWGLKETRIGGESNGAHTWQSPVERAEDIEKSHYPEIRVDYEATEKPKGIAAEIFGDLLAVRVKTLWWWSLGLTRLLAELRSLQQITYVDLNTRQEQVIEAIFDYCRVRAAQVGAARRAFVRDAQQGTPLEGTSQQTGEIEFSINAAQLARLRAILQKHDTIKKPGFTVPGILEIKQA